MKIAALSDVHAMADTLALALGDARREGFDELVILGDLLTYGVAPVRTLDLVADAVARDGAILIAGNHDQIYRDLATGGSAYVDSLPGWLRETVDWTARQISADALTGLPWRERHGCGAMLVAHANPYPYGDWTYLNGEEAMDHAAGSVRAQGFSHGLFGHTHRHRHHAGERGSIVTVGSLGQPRDRLDPAPHWAVIELAGDTLQVEPRRVAFDAAAHIAAIRATTLSPATQDRLCGYFA